MADSNPSPEPTPAAAPLDFVRAIVAEDQQTGKYGGKVLTRFPPEPNGYLHIGHAKSICLNFGIARDFGGLCNLRFDDTNPTKEDVEYVDSIMEDVRWLGFDWEDRLFYASDYFEQLYEWAEQLIQAGQAYVCDLNGRPDPRIPRHAHRAGQATAPIAIGRSKRTSTSSAACGPASSPTARTPCGRRSTWPRPTSTCATRCMYRILHATHHRTGDKWCIYPTYDYTHGQIRLDRRDHAFDLHAGVREPPAALRLVPRDAGHLSTRSRSSSPG